jgi:hypothetical protein
MNYLLPSTNEIAKLAPELLPHIVKDQDKFWFVKYKPGSKNEDKRDLLAYSLGKSICNIAEVKLLSDADHGSIKSQLSMPQDSTKENTFLVRLANSYSLDELPNKNLEKAVATELVYSIWIRRRDTHSDNRSYINGIPIFYDHQTAFLSEAHYAHSTVFFMHPQDYGHAPFWRVKKIPDSEIMDTNKARTVSNNTEKAYHYVNDIDKFKQELRLAEEAVIKLATSDVKQLIADAGFAGIEADMINNFLVRNVETLKDDVKHMEKIVYL